jgi:hypothetical protein
MRLAFTSPLDRREAFEALYTSPAITLDQESEGSSSDVESDSSDSSIASSLES